MESLRVKFPSRAKFPWGSLRVASGDTFVWMLDESKCGRIAWRKAPDPGWNWLTRVWVTYLSKRTRRAADGRLPTSRSFPALDSGKHGGHYAAC